MDGLKDSNQSVFSRLLDPAVRLNPFGSSRSGERIYRRAERIAASIVLLTNHVPPDEDLRKFSRKATLEFLETILSLKDELRSSTSQGVRDLEASMRYIVSLLKMMVFAGFVSRENTEIITSAIEELSSFIKLSGRSVLSEPIPLSKEDFSDAHYGHKGRITDIKDSPLIKDKSYVAGGSLRGSSPSSGSTVLSQKGLGIVSALKTGGELNMPDIAAHLPEYGEKTIQRELGLLISKGIVKRTGLKRWSRYSLAA